MCFSLPVFFSVILEIFLSAKDRVASHLIQHKSQSLCHASKALPEWTPATSWPLLSLLCSCLISHAASWLFPNPIPHLPWDSYICSTFSPETSFPNSCVAHSTPPPPSLESNYHFCRNHVNEIQASLLSKQLLQFPALFFSTALSPSDTYVSVWWLCALCP